LNFRRPLGLVLSGGGAHGAWQAGALEALTRSGLNFDHVFGFSAGALNGAAYVFNKMDVLREIFTHIERYRVMRVRPKLAPLTLCSNEAIWEVVSHGGREEEAKAAARCRFTVATYWPEKGKRVYAHYSPRGEEGWDAPWADHVVASCSIPRIFPPVLIKSNGSEKLCIDGGVWGEENLSFDALSDCQDVIVLQMIRPDEMGYRPWGYWAREEQKHREGLFEHTALGLSTLTDLPNAPRVFCLYPTRRLEYSMLSYKNKPCREALALGGSDGELFHHDPRPYLFT
jgi:predicted acylesterase/phospholipase RssA